MSTSNFNDLPRKALDQIFSFIGQSERQKFRIVCHFWRNVIDEDFDVEITINQGNFERFFQCPNASIVEIKNLTTELTGNVAFGARVRSIQFTGKVLSSNVFHVLRFCPAVEKLIFSSLKQVLGIEGVEPVKLPKATSVEIRVRPDQETFTSDEIIVISALRLIQFESLESILISTTISLLDWEDDGDNDEVNYSSSEMTEYSEARTFPVSDSEFLVEVEDVNSQFQSEPDQSVEALEPEHISVTDVDEIQQEQQQQDDIVGTNEAAAQTAAAPTANLHVIINRTANFPNASGSDAVTSASHTSSNSSRRLRHNISQFEARMFLANLELLMTDDPDSNQLRVFNDSISQARLESAMFYEISGVANTGVKHGVFFEFARNNYSTLKNLQVHARPDFMCFGNLSQFTKDVPKVQFEEIDYSFGRMQICYEYTLLRSQHKLKKLKTQILDDLWKHLMIAVENSHETLTDLDIKVMSVGDDRVSILPITKCSNLKNLKLLHFFDKENEYQLPRSLNRLVVNGPVTYHEMENWASQLEELVEFTLLLNTLGDKIDLLLYKKFLKMPKLSKLTLIQCPMDFEAIKDYVDHIPIRNGLKFWVNGPLEISDMPSIQYVYTFIKPEQFNREQIQIE